MTRRGLAFLPLAFLLLAVAEIAAFVAVVNWVGALWAIFALGLTSLAGLALLRREGIRGWRAFMDAASSGRPPGEQVSNSLVGLLGALLLAVPGFITAAVGVLLLVPPFRSLAVGAARRMAERRISSAVAGDLFGPRRVRVRRGDPVRTPDADPAASVSSAGPVSSATSPGVSSPAPAAPSPGVVEGEVVEGEIVR